MINNTKQNFLPRISILELISVLVDHLHLWSVKTGDVVVYFKILCITTGFVEPRFLLPHVALAKIALGM